MDEFLRRIREWFLRELPSAGWRRFAAQGGRWAWLLLRRLRRDRVFLRSAGMAYMTLVALVPMLMLIFGMLEATGVLANDPKTIEELVFRSFLGDIAEVREFLLPGLLQIDLATLGVVGIGGLLVVAVRLYILVEQAYCEIFSVPVERPLHTRLLIFYAGLTLAPVVLIAMILRASELATVMGMSLGPGVAVNLVQYTVLLMALKGFPATRVSWPAALTGTLVSVLLLESALRGFRMYLSVFAAEDPLHVIYGSLGVLPVFLLWLYMTWLTVLLGVEVAALIQDYEAMYSRELALLGGDLDEEGGPGIASALLVASVIAANFLEGDGAVDRAALVESTDLSPRDVGEVLHTLERGGLVVSAQQGWLMTSDPHKIQLQSVVDLWRAHVSPVGTDHVGVERIRAELDHAVQGTLAEAAGRWS
jgi:membrane protein